MCRSIGERRARSSRRSRPCSATRCIGRRGERDAIRWRSPALTRRGLPRSAGLRSRRRADAASHRAALAGRHRRAARSTPSDAVIALGPWAPDLLDPLGIKLPLAFKRGYHRHFRARGNAGLSAADRRYRIRLLPHADGAGHPPDHRRRIRRRAMRRRRRCSSSGCCRRRASCFRWASRSRRSRGWARGRVLPIHGRSSGARRGQRGPMARLRSCPLGTDARAGHRPTGRRDDHGRHAVLRSGAIRRGAVHAVTSFRAPRLRRARNLPC